MGGVDGAPPPRARFYDGPAANPAGADPGPRLFANLDAGGRFVRDTAVGGFLHRRAVSYRERQAFDGVHLCVEGNRVTAHVDQYSPLNLAGRGRLRYSLPGMVAHWSEDVVRRCVRRLLGRARADHCRLDCGIEWVPDDELGDDEDFEVEAATPARSGTALG